MGMVDSLRLLYLEIGNKMREAEQAKDKAEDTNELWYFRGQVDAFKEVSKEIERIIKEHDSQSSNKAKI